MLKNKVSIERQINERLYQFLVPSDSPLSEVLAIVNDIREYVLQRMKEHEESQKKEEVKPVEEVTQDAN